MSPLYKNSDVSGDIPDPQTLIISLQVFRSPLDKDDNEHLQAGTSDTGYGVCQRIYSVGVVGPCIVTQMSEMLIIANFKDDAGDTRDDTR